MVIGLTFFHVKGHLSGRSARDCGNEGRNKKGKVESQLRPQPLPTTPRNHSPDRVSEVNQEGIPRVNLRTRRGGGEGDCRRMQLATVPTQKETDNTPGKSALSGSTNLQKKNTIDILPPMDFSTRTPRSLGSQPASLTVTVRPSLPPWKQSPPNNAKNLKMSSPKVSWFWVANVLSICSTSVLNGRGRSSPNISFHLPGPHLQIRRCGPTTGAFKK